MLIVGCRGSKPGTSSKKRVRKVAHPWEPFKLRHIIVSCPLGKRKGCATLHTLGKAEKPAFFTVLHRKIKAVQLCTPLAKRKTEVFHCFSTKNKGCATLHTLVNASKQLGEVYCLIARQEKG